LRLLLHWSWSTTKTFLHRVTKLIIYAAKLYSVIVYVCTPRFSDGRDGPSSTAFLQIHESKIFYNNISSFLREKDFSFLCILPPEFLLIKVFPQESLSFKLVNKFSRTVRGEVVYFWKWQLLLPNGWHFDCLF